MKDGIALTNIPHPEGDPVTDDHEFNPDSLETIEVDIPVMPEYQLETWMHNMIRACNRSTSDSDINVIKLIQHIENLYMQGRADEREEIAQWLSSGIRLDGLTTEPLILQFTVDLIEAIGKLIRERGDIDGNN